MLSTLDAIRSASSVLATSLVYRYDPETAASDGLAGRRGHVQHVLLLAGRGARPRRAGVDEARLLFEQMLGYANHLGLYAEQTGAAGEALGNFPQAFTHLALISAAFTLDRTLEGGHPTCSATASPRTVTPPAARLPACWSSSSPRHGRRRAPSSTGAACAR